MGKGKMKRTLRYNYEDGRFTCGDCKKKLDKKDSCYSRTFYSHKYYISINNVSAGQYITLNGRPYFNIACKLCGKSGFSKADYVVRHLGSQAHRGKEMEYRIEFTNIPKPKTHKGLRKGKRSVSRTS